MKTPKKPSTRIDEHDRLSISLSAERAARLNLQHELAVKHANDLASQRNAHGQTHATLVERLKAKYALGSDATIDLETGVINRAPPQSAETEKKEN